MENIKVGSKVVIGPAYSMDTKKRTIVDDCTGVVGTVVELSGEYEMRYALVETRTTEIHVNVGRLDAA
jgi:hypothetical protein